MVFGTKQESWVSLAEWLEALREYRPDRAPFVAFVAPVLKACTYCGLDQYFRVGHQLFRILFSTTEEHGLEKYQPPPPLVILCEDAGKNRVVIFWGWNFDTRQRQIERQDTVNAENVFPVLKAYLADLWQEASPGDSRPLPLIEQPDF